MAETVYFVNASDLFSAIELGDCEQTEFLLLFRSKLFIIENIFLKNLRFFTILI